MKTGALSRMRSSRCSLATCQAECASLRTTAQLSDELPRTVRQSSAMSGSTAPQGASG